MFGSRQESTDTAGQVFGQLEGHQAMPSRQQPVSTLDIVSLLGLIQDLELLQDVDSVVEDVQHDGDEHCKADSPGGAC